MKFSDGYWSTRKGFTPLFAREVDDVRWNAATGTMAVYAPTARIRSRGDTLNLPMITEHYSAPAEGVIKVRITHYAGAADHGPHFEVHDDPDFHPSYVEDDDSATLSAGLLSVRVAKHGPWHVDFIEDGKVVTQSLPKSVGVMEGENGDFVGGKWIHEQLTLQPGESVYGLGERFGPFIKNGQSVDIWNEDGGTSSEQAYKNIPFYFTTAGYGVFVAHPERVSFEVASEVNTRVQFSVPGNFLEYYVIAGPTPKEVLRRYTALTGRAPQVPNWSYGLWLTTSFTTNYDENTVNSFVDGMAERDLPLSVFHFDCFWMPEYEWSGLQWDKRVFPDPEGQIKRLHDRGLKVCVWINPYIAQRTAMFDEGMEKGYLLKTADGGVWQWDKWQAGMALADFTNPEATAWYVSKLEELLDQGVDCFKTDFGERVPTEGVVWFDGSDPQKMHNYYTQLYNKAVFDLLKRKRGEGEAVLFARSATAGGQQFPVHWGGDCDSTYVSMAESLRGGLSLLSSGFGYWSHDIGGFEGTPDPGVFKRWLPFGLLSSHSRLHGSNSYRVPWAFDEPGETEAVDVTRKFTNLKMTLMPYLLNAADQVTEVGTPIMRPMVLEFPADRSAHSADTQYMLGDSLLVAPVFSGSGDVEYYVPDGTWTRLVDSDHPEYSHDSTVTGPRWVRENHDFTSLPLLVRPGTVLPIGARNDSPEYDYADNLTLRCFELPDGYDSVTTVPGSGNGPGANFRVRRTGDEIIASTSDARGSWVVDANGHRATGNGPGEVRLALTS